MRLHDALGTIFEDSEFADLFGRRGKPAEIPWRLGLVCIVQYMENLTDREVADESQELGWISNICWGWN
jgi:transposase